MAEMNAQEIIEAEAKYVLQTYIRPEIVFTHGEGAYLYDTDGNRYLDFTSGIAVMSLGHSNAAWATAVTQQAARLTHVSNLYHTAPHALLAKRLVENSFADKVYFCNSGAEANEAAIKFARKYGKGIGDQGSGISKTKVVAFTGSFHGRTMGALAVTYKSNYRKPFEPLMPDAMFATFNDLDSAAGAIDDNTCAVIVEPIQGEGGVNPAAPEFLQGLRHLCNEHDALLIYDEVQVGLGRTGHLWAHEAFGVTPDMMTLAKPLAGGLPIGATLVTQKVADIMQPGDHASTFAAGPLVCAAANVVFDQVSDAKLLQQVQENGAYLQHKLHGLESDHIVAIRGTGMLVGMQLDTAVSTIIPAARDKGLMIINAGEDVIRLAPPLIVSKEQIDTAVSIIGNCLEEIS
ncbi:MAG: aspartate aminotransferase family protein [Anaerolineales bacterium]|nr:aspartate aminotransferase family protein [Anaerolineales bacterium]MCA9927479.1 aspartate aminotransferase family protein [Anaerolineales bacterium]